KLTGNTSAVVTWDRVTGASGYYVQYRASKTGLYTTAAILRSATTQSFVLSGKVPSGTTLYVRVVAYHENLGTGVRTMGLRPTDVKCTRATKTVTTTLSAPKVSLRLTGLTSAIATWNQVSGASGYYVQYRTTQTGSYQTAAVLSDPSAQSYVLSGRIPSGTTIYARVVAYFDDPSTGARTMGPRPADVQCTRR
ncbi:MAG TPA: hypothetical protein PKN45_11980, partial [Candidatus Limiplasma sp.]|nr:hypothetical protein [Candidatus Limiplasma sp.]